MAVTAPDLDPYRLPRWVVPIRYDLRLSPSLEDAAFTGRVVIELEVIEPTELVVLNAADLEILGCTVDGAAATWELWEDTERLAVRPGDELTAGRSVLEIEFSGVLNDLLRGFYRSTYTDDTGSQHVIATSQMQATDCRRAFPCWDEPEFKAVFGITLDIADGLFAISNAPEIDRTTTDGRTLIRFADTMTMSTYLVAFVVGDLEATDVVDVDGIPVRVVHVPGKGHLTSFALDVAAFCLRWFQEYYDIDYPGQKVDLVALPDFAAGAMENLGCITFRESLLLVDPQRGTQHERSLVADVVAHELAHMWFGDLVTMRWWNGVWLNEAFATFMEVAATDAYRPDWERWTNFGVARTAAFETDSLSSTRSVEYAVESPADCEGMFDVLTYEKGGALLRMLEQYLGPERFRDGVRHYLTTHSYGNTETNDLWDAIESTTGDPVRDMMDSWIWQPGYPLVSAELAGSDDRPQLLLSQRRFGFDATTEHGAASWLVPVSVRAGTTTTTHLLDRKAVVAVPLDDPSVPIVVNAGGAGFFRTAYDPELRDRLAGDVLAEMSTLERYNLVDDAWSATVAGQMTSPELLSFLEGFGAEREHAVWQSIIAALGGLTRLVDGDARDALQRRIAALLAPALEELGTPADGEPELSRKLRGLLTRAAGTIGDDDAVQAWCRSLYEAWRADPAAVDAELAAAAIVVVAATADAATYDVLRSGYADAETPQDRLRHLYALAEVDDRDLLVRTREYVLGPDVRTQDAPFVLRIALNNRVGGADTWAFLVEHWDEASRRFPSNSIVRMIGGITSLNTPELVEQVQAFFADHPIEQSITTQRQLLERQRINAALRSRDEQRLAAALTAL